MISTVELLRVTGEISRVAIPCASAAAGHRARLPGAGRRAPDESLAVGGCGCRNGARLDSLTVAASQRSGESPPVVGLTGDLPLSCACTSELRFARYPQMVFVTVPAPILAASIPAPSCVFVAVAGKLGECVVSTLRGDRARPPEHARYRPASPAPAHLRPGVGGRAEIQVLARAGAGIEETGRQSCRWRQSRAGLVGRGSARAGGHQRSLKGLYCASGKNVARIGRHPCPFR